MNSIDLKGKTLQVPIIQGGMGVAVSLGNLAGHVMREGGMGVISAAHPGFREPDFMTNNVAANLRAIHQEILKARAISDGKGLLGVNVMTASRAYKEICTQLAKEPIDVLISGAGMPVDLPAFVEGSEVMLAPIVSSGKAARLICTVWDKRYNRIPDFIVIEGPLAGGHLGFGKEDLKTHTEASLESILIDVKREVEGFEIKYQRKIPLVAAGGIYTHEDIESILGKGADAVQMATRFIGTYECDAAPEYKQAFIDCVQSDIGITVSPVGLPGRAIINEFVRGLDGENHRISKCVACLTPCNPAATPYCITEALIQAVKGNVNEGLIFTGANGYRINEIVTVRQLMHELITGDTDA